MPNVTSALVIADGAAANKTFAIQALSPALSIFAEKTGGFSQAYKVLKVSFDPASARRKTNKATFDLDYPIVRTINGVATVTDVARARVSFTLPESMIASELLDVTAFTVNGMNHASIKPVFNATDPMY